MSAKKKQFSGQVTKTRAIKIFEALGFKTAGKWDVAKLQKKLLKLDTLIEGTDLDKKNLKKVNEILSAQAKLRKVIVVDVEDVAAGKQREKEVKDAAAREVKRKAEQKTKAKVKEKAETKKTAKKAKAKKTAKKAVAASDKKKKPGLMLSMYEFIQAYQPISANKILSLLEKRFPEHNSESMERCIPRYPKCLADSHGITDIGQDDKERYIIVKK